MITPLVSVIIPVFNVVPFLREALDSVISQTYVDLEIILIDDGSTDSCPSMCDSYAEEDSRVHVIHKENSCLSDARNRGIMKATGEYIVFVDSDDYVDDDYISYLYGLITKYNTSMSICQHRVMSDGRLVDDKGSAGDECLPSKTCLPACSTTMLLTPPHDVQKRPMG